MATVQPSIGDSPSFHGMTVPDEVDLFAAVAAVLGTGIVSGCLVTQHTGSDMAVNVSAGTVAILGNLYTYAGTTNLAVSAASTGDRRDTIIMRLAAGAVTAVVIKGTPLTGLTGAGWTDGVLPSTSLPPMKGPMNWSSSTPSTSVNYTTDAVCSEAYVAYNTTGIAGTTSTIVAPTSGNLVDKTTPPLVLTGSSWNESVMKAISLDQFTPAAASVNMTGTNGAEHFINLGQGILSTDSAQLGQLAGTQYAYIVSGCLWTPDAANSTKVASMTSGTCMIKGILLTVAAVTSRTFTANDDTYVDFTDNGDGTAAITYSVVANNGFPPALAGTSCYDTLRNAVVTCGASAIVSQAKINQGDPNQALAATTLATTTNNVSGTPNVSATTMVVAANSLAPAGLAVADTSAGTGNNFGSLIKYTGGGGTTTLTGITLLAGSGTLTNGGAVTQVSCTGSSVDGAGNLIYPTSGEPTTIGWKQNINAVTTTKLTLISDIALTALFIVPAGPPRRVKMWTNISYLSSTATAGTALSVAVGYATLAGGGSFTNPGTSQHKEATAGDGTSMRAEGEALLTPGTYVLSAQYLQGAAGTMTRGVATYLCSVGAELVG